jgi:regulator of protease activity HflC (stomatin/prohibitin superfamily)
MRSILAALPILILAVIGAGVIGSNYHNVQAPAGCAAYVVERPIMGSTTFQQVIMGPGSTGLMWRAFGDVVSITPYSYSELFENTGVLIAKDKLPIIGGAHIVWQLRREADQVKNYMEKYGGLDVAHSPDEIARESYENYIKEPFRTLVREEFAKYEGLAVPDHLADMGQSIQDELTARLKDTPFQVIQVVVGNAQPPAQVLEKIALKVAAVQELERKATELEIANRSKEIEKANGDAAGEHELALAEKRAEANAKLAASLTPMLLQYLAIENLKTAEKIYLPIGPGGLPIIKTVDDAMAPASPSAARP